MKNKFFKQLKRNNEVLNRLKPPKFRRKIVGDLIFLSLDTPEIRNFERRFTTNLPLPDGTMAYDFSDGKDIIGDEDFAEEHNDDILMAKHMANHLKTTKPTIDFVE